MFVLNFAVIFGCDKIRIAPPFRLMTKSPASTQKKEQHTAVAVVEAVTDHKGINEREIDNMVIRAETLNHIRTLR